MLASLDKGFVLLFNPKTGTSALESAFERHAEIKIGGTPHWKHLDYVNMKKIFGGVFDDCKIYAVVRDPIDTLFSWYSYRARPMLRSPTHRKHKNFTGNITWEDFVTDWAKPSPPPYAQIRDPVSFVQDTDGDIGPINIYRYEDLKGLHQTLCRHVGKNPKLTVKNSSPNIDIDVNRDWVMEFDKMTELMNRYNKITFAYQGDR